LSPRLNVISTDETRSQLIARLEAKAAQMRYGVMTTLEAAGSGHVGGSMSSADILTALYFHTLRVDPANPGWEDRDRFVLSKGHASAILCPVLADCGFFPKSLLETFNQLDSPFSMHPDMLKIPGADMSTGSLGHGLSIGLGMALAAKVQKKDFRAFVLMGDGELAEGSVWEAAMAAPQLGLDNLVAIVDRNRFGSDCATSEIVSAEPIPEKWAAFGWPLREIDGHDMGAIVDALDAAPFEPGKPSVIIANTIKGKGVPMAEARFDWHYHYVDTDLVDQCEMIMLPGQAVKGGRK
jgi:transketolase